VSETAPTGERPREWWVRPGIMLPVVGVIIVLVALLTPEPSPGGRIGDSRLSTHITSSLGARVLLQTAARLGWKSVARDSLPTPTDAPGGTIHAVLAPLLPVTPAQAHRYLEAVRGGDALLYVIGDRSPLGDSLGVWHTPQGGVLDVSEASKRGCPDHEFTPPLWPDGEAHLYGIRWVTDAHHGHPTFARVSREGMRGIPPFEEAAAGFPLSAGRVVVVADPDLLRNDVLRRCEWGADVIAVQMLEYLRAGGSVPRTTIEFDEFHQGYGPRRSATVAIGRFLTRHPVGRVLLQVGLAALVLLLAFAPRPIAPHQQETIERRDPLEQVDALAHAYQQVGATRTVTARLLRGVRGRVERAGPLSHGRTDASFLDDVAADAPERAADAAAVKRALREAGTPRDLPAIGAALRRIEETLTTTRA
jgi:hypothetical protein